MNDLTTFILAMGQPPGGSNASQPGFATFINTFGVPILMFVMLYFVLIRPQTKAKKEHEKMLTTLKTGDKVTMSSGILGTVTNVKDKDIAVVKIADNVKIEVLKSSITAISRDEIKEETK